MRIGLFASGRVGLEIAQFFGELGESVECLALDTKSDSNQNQEIVKSCQVSRERVLLSDFLYEPKSISLLKSMSLDLIVLAWWPYILKEELIGIPSVGWLNFHPSYLPYNRGKHYNFWTIVEDTPFGVTLHFIDKGVDSGDIAYQSRIQKSWEDTGETLYRKAQAEIVRLFKEKYSEIKAGRIPRVQQDPMKGTAHKSKELEAASEIKLDKTYSGRTLLNLLRARTFPPHPAAWFLDGDERYEVQVSIKRVNK